MTLRPFTVKRLEKEDRSAFTCGKDDLDRYFKKQISQDMRRQIATAFIARHNMTDTIAGFYTLSAAQVPFTALDDDWRKKLPPYPSLPAVLIGRLAIDRRFKGQGLGSALLADAAARTMRADIAAHFLIVDALDEDAARFYLHHGFRRIPGDGKRLFIPLATLEKLLAS
jgi:ribosomal protein S18 acetylase RimI-like enzyme